MWEAVAIALISHIGKVAIDKFWTNKDPLKSTVVNNAGIISYSGKDPQGRTVISKNITGIQYQQSGTLFGKLYLPDTLQNTLVGDEVALVLVIGEDNDQVLLFEADMYNGYVIDLPFGLYSVFTFVLDPTAVDLFSAEIYGVGLPNAEHIDLTGIDFIDVDNYDDILDLVDLSPVRIFSTQPCFLDFIVFDTDVETDLPRTFSEIFAQESEVFGYYCPRCNTHVTYIICSCGAEIDRFTCPACGVQSPVSDICPNCYTDIKSLRCYRCRNEIDTLICPSCSYHFSV